VSCDPSDRSRPEVSPSFAALASIALFFLLSACAAPVGVERISPLEAQRDLTRSVISTGQLSEKARVLLRRANREQEWRDDPTAVLERFHDAATRPMDEFDAELRASVMDAVAELAFAHAARTGDRRYFLAAAMYAWFYLFPLETNEPPRPPPLPPDRGVRLAADIYNRGIALALTDPESGEVVLEDDEHELPFGTLDIDFDEAGLRWGNRDLERFVSVADLRVRGLNNRYRVSGLGAPLAARISRPIDGDEADPIFDEARVPVTALLHFEDVDLDVLEGRYTAILSLIPFTARTTERIHDQDVPLEVDSTATLALQLTETPPWRRELSGFFQGDLALGREGLVSLSPFQRNRIPLVLVHGTASSAGRWADMINDLHSDPVIQRYYQTWLFSYNTGNPILFSGWLLRKEIRDLIEGLDPAGENPVLRELVVLGHSQGGLLTKLLAVDSGERFWDQIVDQPPDEVELEPESRELLEGSLLVEPSPNVRRVIFLSTPHRGSRLADLGIARLLGRAVRSPANLVLAAGDLFQEDVEEEVQRRLRRGAGAIGNMSPKSPFIQTLSDLPIASGIHAHSILGVRGKPIEESSDGVVSFESAHMPQAESELIVESGHSSQSNPEVIWEVRRILLEHLRDGIERGVFRDLD
jgi:pimeloyl-ACP methyl ester carboxylesterase